MLSERDRQPGRLMTSLLAVVLAVSTLATPAAIGAGAHDCCRRGGRAPMTTTVQCCMPARPAPPPQAPPTQGPTLKAPDLAPVLPAVAPAVEIVQIRPVVALPALLVAPPPIYLLNATLLV
jgi:hypothetical protein